MNNQKGFIQIPLLIIVVVSVVIASAGTGVILHKQGKLSSITANISGVFKKEVEESVEKNTTEEFSVEQNQEVKGFEKELETTDLETENKVAKPSIIEQNISSPVITIESRNQNIESKQVQTPIEPINPVQVESNVIEPKSTNDDIQNSEEPSVQLDITSPIISNIKTYIKLQSLPTSDSVIIEWSTNEPTLGRINFGGEMKCSIDGCESGYSSFRVFKQDESYNLHHRIIIERDLKPATEYKYYIYAIDEAGNETGFYDGKIITELPVLLPELNGQYNVDIFLTKDKSPYTATGDVFINKKLHIDSGVEIKFSGDYKLVVNGTFGVIKVNGTKNEPVSFGFNQSSDSSSKGIYIRSNNDNIIDNAIIEFAFRGISVDSSQSGVWANAIISNSTIKNNSIGVWINKSNAKITNSIITQNRTGVHSVFNSKVEMYQNNIFNNDHIALSFETGSILQLKFNNIYNNKDIIRIYPHPLTILSQNNISLENDRGYIYFGSGVVTSGCCMGSNIDARNNWWGTTDISVISQRIKEYRDFFFNYQPVATSEISNAGVQ